MDTFRVYARCRPLNESQINYGASRKAVSIIDENTLCLSGDSSKQHTFQLDGVFDQSTTNIQIFNQAIVPLIDNVINGINSTAFAYGITGAGKSFTMFGKTQLSYDQYNRPNQLSGIIPLTFEYLANLCQNQPDTKIRLSYLQIYNQQVFDLLQQTQQNLLLSQDPVQGCVIVQDLTQVQLYSFQQAQQLIAIGNSRRVIAETKANQVSSRSHAIVLINMDRKMNDMDQYYSAKLSLVDLAGSEKQSVHAQTRGIRTFQGSNINRSLLTLGNCINILSQKRKQNNNFGQQFIPYRDSKLTRLLKDSLGGNTKTVMIACISPSSLCYDETVNTLKYACRANKIQKVVHQNIRQVKSAQDYKKQINALKKQNQILKMNLNMSLMMPGLSVGIVEQQIQTKKNIVSNLLGRLTKIIKQRTILQMNNRQEQSNQAIQRLLATQQQIRKGILSQFQSKNNINRNKEPPRNEIEQNQLNRLSQSIKQQNYQPQNQTKKLNPISRQSFAKQDNFNNKTNNNPSNYQLSLKQQFKKYQKMSQAQQNLKANNQLNIIGSNKSKGYSLVNLQNLRKKVMQDKKQFANFKQQIQRGLLTKEQILAKAVKLIQMGEQSIMRFSEQQFAYLRKLVICSPDGEIKQRYSSIKKKIDSANINSMIAQPSQFALSMIQQNIAAQPSRNRHLKSLNRIISLAKHPQHHSISNYSHMHQQNMLSEQNSSFYQPQYNNYSYTYQAQNNEKYNNTYRIEDCYDNQIYQNLSNRNFSQLHLNDQSLYNQVNYDYE